MKRAIISDRTVNGIFYITIAFFALACVVPFLLILSVSLSNEHAVSLRGFSLIPMGLTLYTYTYLFINKGIVILEAYEITFAVLILGTLFSVFVTTCYSYAASFKKFRFANALSFIAWFTMIFNGGLLPWYILTTKYYHLKNNLFALFVPYAMNVFYMFVMRNFFKSISSEYVESAKIDGAGNLRIFATIVLPIAKVGLITITLFYALGYWNDFYLAFMLISKQRLYPMQMLLYAMESNIMYLANSNTGLAQHGASTMVIPLMTTRMAVACIAIGPIIIFYPFAQRYFVKGLTVGAIKG